MKSRAVQLLIPLIGIIFLVSDAFAQAPKAEGAITDTLLEEIQASFKRDASTKVGLNALTSNKISDVGINRDALINRDKEFTHVIKREGVTDQKETGRCWLFAGLNILRHSAAKKMGIDDFELSQNFSFFWHKLEVANYFFEKIIENRSKDHLDREMEWLYKHSTDDGGYWNMVVSTITKYGVVPKSVMPETISSEDTGKLNDLLDTLVKKHAVVMRKMSEDGKNVMDIRGYKVAALKDVYRLLALTLSEPPKGFEWRYMKEKAKTPTKLENYTPKSFMARWVDVALNDMLSLSNDPTRPYYQRYRIKWTKNMVEDEADSYINLPIEELIRFAKDSVLKDKPVWFGCDVGKFKYLKEGILKPDIYNYKDLFGVDFSMTKADRLKTYATAANHAMLLTGVDMKSGEPVKWLVENSWGDDTEENKEKGFLIMYTDWFKEFVYQVIIDKKLVTKKVLEAAKTKPVELPAWDPMWLN